MGKVGGFTDIASVLFFFLQVTSLFRTIPQRLTVKQWWKEVSYNYITNFL